MAGLLHSPALWHNSPQNTLTCKWVASAAAARWRCNSWHAHDPWHGGLARTRPEAPRATPRWATDVTLLTSNDGSVPLPSGGQCGREGWDGRLRKGRSGSHTEWGSGSSADWLRCWWAWKKREMMLHSNTGHVAAGAVWETSQKIGTRQCINQTNYKPLYK